MHSSFYVALGALAALAAADNPNSFNIPNGGYQFKTGEPTTLKWNPSTDGTVSLKLQSGDVLTPDSGSTIASNIDNSGKYTWTPPKDLVNESDYTIEIVDDSGDEESNYLPRFSVSGATATASSTASATTSDASSTSNASTSSASSTLSQNSTTASPSTMTTTTGTTSSSTSSTSTSLMTSTTSTSSSSASASGSASSTSPASASATANDTSAGMVNRVSGSLMAIALGVFAFM